MKNDDNKIKDVRNTVNLISGAYTLPLINKLFPNSQRIEDMEDIYFSITSLVDTDRISEAFHMIRGLFGIAGMVLSGKLNDALSGRLFYADFGSHGGNSHFKNGCFCELFS